MARLVIAVLMQIAQRFHSGPLMFTSDAFLRAFALVQGDEPVLGSKIWIRRRGPVKYAYASPWNGFVRNPDLASLIAAARSNSCFALTFTSDSLLADQRLKELSPIPTPIVYPNYQPSKNVRWSVKKAEKTGFDIRESSSQEIQPILSSLWERIGRGISPEFYKILEETGYGHALRADRNDDLAAGLFYVVDESGVCYMYSLATAPAFRRAEVTTLLVHSFIQRALAQGSPLVDLCGCSVESIYRFKRQFASEIRYRPRYIAVLRPALWSLAKWGAKSIYNRLPSHVPPDANWREHLVPTIPV